MERKGEKIMENAPDLSANLTMIGGIFDRYADARRACFDFIEKGIRNADIQLVIGFHDPEVERCRTWKKALQELGMPEAQAEDCQAAVLSGKILVVVHNVEDAVPILEVFERLGQRVPAWENRETEPLEEVLAA
jgi:hypothetical protein